MKDKLEILKYHKDKSKEGYIGIILYNEKALAKFDKEKGLIDLSVLNPFVGKEAFYYNINVDTQEETCKKILIEKMENKVDLGWVLYFKEIEEEREISNASSEN